MPVIETAASYTDAGIDPGSWRRAPHRSLDGGVNVDFFAASADPLNNTSSLQAWNPVTQKPAWKVPTPGHWNGGVLATAGDLVFQGTADGKLTAYDAADGDQVWQFDAGLGIILDAERRGLLTPGKPGTSDVDED